ncbi:LCP family protein [Nocardioides yefusunii]|uniref:LCP family protein n=1 Tax=Nocardioides yefusunii TaxID=2500546 RepID=A0ABW1QX83_9ACTN|nr:LCP family protein [Nocardioides yefusunii]
MDEQQPRHSVEPGSAAPSDVERIAAQRKVAGKRRGKPKRSRTIFTVLASTVLVLALVTGLGVVFAYRHLQANIEKTDPFAHLDNADRPEDYGDGKSKTVLIMGLDTREGENAIDDEQGLNGSDTTILVHVSADRTRAYGVSIPRDSIVDRPACGSDDEVPAKINAQWNEAYSVGGAACTVAQFEAATGVRVDETIEVKFAGFVDMVDAVGGVPMCVPRDITDPKTGQFFPKGERDMDGEEALGYVRLRYIGSGSDLDRITRQQTFVASLVNKVVSKGTLARFDKVYKFANATTKSLMISEGLADLKELAKFGLSLNSVGLHQIQFLTVPNGAWDQNPNRVAWKPEAQEMWDKIAHDEALGEEFTADAIAAGEKKEKKPKKDASASAAPSASPSSEPSVDVTKAPEDEGPTEAEIAAAAEKGLCL